MFSLFSKPTPAAIGRNIALEGCPVQMPIVKKERENNKLMITVELNRPGWQQMLGAEKMCEKTFALDEYGEEVYSYCSGNMEVKKMAEQFSKKHRISLPEAEISVATFLRTMMEKGLIGIEIKKATDKTD